MLGRGATFLTFVALVVSCDKLKSVAGGAEAGATAEPSTASGGPAATTATGGGVSFTGSEFEGEITMKMTGKSAKAGEPTQIVWVIKKPKYRMDMGGTANSASYIMDLPTKKGWLLAHSQKIAMPIDLDKAKSGAPMPGMPGGGAPPARPTTPPTIEKTGKTDTVAGYKCDVWKLTSEGKKSEVCMAEGIAWVDMGGMGAPGMGAAVMASEGSRFPLRVIAYDAQNAEEFRMEAQKVDKKSIEDARFVPPPDYKQFNMAGMPGMPPNMPGMPTKR